MVLVVVVVVVVVLVVLKTVELDISSSSCVVRARVISSGGVGAVIGSADPSVSFNSISRICSEFCPLTEPDKKDNQDIFSNLINKSFR